MNAEDEYNKHFVKLQKLQDFMLGDLRRSSKKAQANFLVAMGVFNYIEILGSFYKYNQTYIYKRKRKKLPLEKRFNFVINNLFDHSYKKELIRIRKIFGGTAYDIFRCGLSHEYLVKTYKSKRDYKLFFTVVNPNDENGYSKISLREKCGIRMEKVNKNIYKVIIFNPKFVEDFNQAFEEYKTRLEMNLGRYRLYFIRRAKVINFDLMS